MYNYLMIRSQNAVVNNKVAHLRVGRSLSQEELATLVGVTRQTILSIEKGSHIPSVLLAIKLAKVFKKSVEEVFKIKGY